MSLAEDLRRNRAVYALLATGGGQVVPSAPEFAQPRATVLPQAVENSFVKPLQAEPEAERPESGSTVVYSLGRPPRRAAVVTAEQPAAAQAAPPEIPGMEFPVPEARPAAGDEEPVAGILRRLDTDARRYPQDFSQEDG